MAYGDYEHCPICDADFESELRKNPKNIHESGKTFPGYKLLYMGDQERPEGMVVLCEEHALALKPYIDALIKEVKN